MIQFWSLLVFKILPMKNGKRKSNFLASWYLKKFELTIILFNFLLISFPIGPFPNQALLLRIFWRIFRVLNVLRIEDQTLKMPPGRSGQNIMSWSPPWPDYNTVNGKLMQMRPCTTCSQRTSKPFKSMTKHLWLVKDHQIVFNLLMDKIPLRLGG